MPVGYLVTVTLVAVWVGFYWLVLWTLVAFGQGDVDSPGGRLEGGLAVLATAGLAVIAWRGLRAGPVVEHALTEALGTRILLRPLSSRRDVERVANIRYDDAGRSDLLDVYRHRSRPAGAAQC